MTNRRTFQWLTLAIMLALPGPAFAQDKDNTNDNANDNAVDLPMVRAVMFSSGVGYFEHAGTVEGNANVQLMFDRSQINDVLKSMVVMDTDGGTVTRATYPTKDPIERTLSSFAVDLSGKPTLPQLLDQLRGARLTAHAPNAVTGRILSVEKRTQVVDETKVVEHLLTLATDDGLRTVTLENVDRVQLDDADLQSELNKALTTLAGARDTERRPVTLRFEGEGERRVRIGYLVETPVWKTSYRLDLTRTAHSSDQPDDAEGDQSEALLQGWAMVENMTESDWQGIDLSLVSGQPISYTMDLYTPLYVDRPNVEIPRYAALKPRMHGEGMAANEEAKKLSQQRRGQAGRARETAARMMESAPASAGAGFARSELSAAQLGDSVQSQAQAGSVGELFRFTLDHPVSLDRRQSAMLPIVSDNVKAQKVSIYNQQQDKTHPMSGVELTNSTDLKLLAGPVTVLDGGMYAGDALIDHMTPDETRLLSYAVDLSVTVDPSSRSSQHILSGRIVRGVLYVSRRQDYTQTYRIKNKADEKRTMIVEHPYNSSRQLVEPEKADEKTPKWYRFRVPVEADTTGEFTVREERMYSQSIALLDRPVGEFLAYTKTGDIDNDVREALQKAIDMKRELSKLQRDREQKQNELNEITGGQERLRRNIGTVGRDSTLGKRYVKKLADQEDRIEALRDEIADLSGEIRAQEKKLADYLENLNVR